MSFPSGHSSYSMCAGLFLYLLILRCLNEVKWIKASVMQMIKALTLIVCLAIPVIVGGSRIVSTAIFQLNSSLTINTAREMFWRDFWLVLYLL